MLPTKKITLPLTPELKTSLLRFYGRKVSILRFDDAELPVFVKELVELGREKIGLRDTIKEFMVQASHHARDDGSFIQPAAVGTIGRLLVNINVKELYGVVSSGVGEYMQALSDKAGALTPVQAKKIKLPRIKADRTILLEDSEALFIAPPQCNQLIFTVQKNPHRIISNVGRQITHIRPRNYDRLTLVIDYYFQPSEEDMKKFMEGMKIDPAEKEGDVSNSYEIDLEQQIEDMEHIEIPI